MKNFTKKIRSKSIIVLLSLLSVFFVLSVTFTMSKYVIEKQVGNITLNLTSVDTLIPGLQLRNTLGTSVTEVVFGLTKDYENEIAGIEPINVDVQKKGKIKLYVNGTKAYILSDRKIYANPDCWHTFYELTELTSVDFSNFETGMVTNMRGMFRGCTKLTEVKNITSWNTKNVEDMEFLFRDCPSLTTLDLSGWNTAKVKILYGTFYNCSGLTSLDVSSWDTSAAKNIGDTFYGCSGLTSLDVSNWNIDKATQMHYIFYNCSSLTSLDVSSWDTGKVSNMRNLFRDCNKLTAIDVSSWNTESAKDMFCMFYGCGNLTALDLSSWNTAGVTDMSHMFFSCGSLVSVYAGSGWNTDNVSSSGKMFEQCKKLKGGQGTSYDSAHTDKAYARIDGGAENPGYFTDIADKP